MLPEIIPLTAWAAAARGSRVTSMVTTATVKATKIVLPGPDLSLDIGQPPPQLGQKSPTDIAVSRKLQDAPGAVKRLEESYAAKHARRRSSQGSGTARDGVRPNLEGVSWQNSPEDREVSGDFG